jgi:uncharacterized phage protein (TIGR02218 family)
VKTLTPALAAAVAAPVTTLARAWIATRRDGAVFGFTDHDRDLVVAGVPCRAATGVGQSEAVAAAGLSVGGQEITGALSSEAIAEADIAAGLWDGATIRAYVVDWSAPDRTLAVTTGVLGEVTRRDGAFTAELRSLASLLDQPKGRVYQHRCDAVFGDRRCGVALAALERTGSIVAVTGGRHLVIEGLTAEARLFTGGVLRATVGGTELRRTIKSDRPGEDGRRLLELWEPAETLAPGDAVRATPGCDRRFETCRDRYGNGLNFRGFPHIPGSDFAIAHPASTSETHDGGALVL